jgi:hypothetical protein
MKNPDDSRSQRHNDFFLFVHHSSIKTHTTAAAQQHNPIAAIEEATPSFAFSLSIIIVNRKVPLR